MVFNLRQLERENSQLRSANAAFAQTLQAREATIAELQKQLETRQIEHDLQRRTEIDHSLKMRAQIDQYVKEIDRCIEWLSNN